MAIRLTNEEYSELHICPNCRSSAIAWGERENADKGVLQIPFCQDCGLTWQEFTAVVGYEIVRETPAARALENPSVIDHRTNDQDDAPQRSTRLSNEIEIIKYFLSHGIKNEWTSRERIIRLLDEFHILSGNLLAACNDALFEFKVPNRGPSGTQPAIDRLTRIVEQSTPK